MLNCSLSNYEASWDDLVALSWEFEASRGDNALVEGGSKSVLSYDGLLTFNMSEQAEGTYHCIAQLSDSDYPINVISAPVQVRLPSKYH